MCVCIFQMEMIFDTDFRLSHTGSGPVYITGYKTQALDQDLLLEDYDDDDNDDDDDDYDDDDDDDSDGDGYTIPQHIEYGRANGAALPSANDDDSDDDSDDDDDDVDDGFVDFEEDDDFDEYEDFDDDDIIGNDDDDDDDDDESSDDDDDDDDIDTQPPPKRSKANTPTPKYASPKVRSFVFSHVLTISVHPLRFVYVVVWSFHATHVFIVEEYLLAILTLWFLCIISIVRFDPILFMQKSPRAGSSSKKTPKSRKR